MLSRAFCACKCVSKNRHLDSFWKESSAKVPTMWPNMAVESANYATNWNGNGVFCAVIGITSAVQMAWK